MVIPKVSVIIPVYNAEKYLFRSVDSLLAQTLQDFEVLLIDDGSPDKSGEICDEYAKKDTRVRVFHKENGGVSSARQYGMNNARGEYTIHVDPDDWVEPNMLEELYAKAKEEDADMVICDYYEEYPKWKKTIYKQQKPSALDHNTVLKELFQQLYGSCWNKLVKRACYNKYDINYPSELTLCEDLYVNISLLIYDIKVTYLPKAFYHYDRNINANSITRHPRMESLKSYLFLISSIEKKLGNNNLSEELYKLKCNAKILSFHLNVPREMFINTFAEINDKFVNEHGRFSLKGINATRFVNMLIAWDIQGHKILVKVLYRAYLFLILIYQKIHTGRLFK